MADEFSRLKEIMHVAFTGLSIEEQEDMLLEALINQRAILNESWGLLDEVIDPLKAGNELQQLKQDKTLASTVAAKATSIRIRETSKSIWSMMAATWGNRS